MKKVLILICYSLVLLFGIVQSNRAQSVAANFLDARLESLDIQTTNIRDALANLAYAFNTPLGMEISPGNFSKEISLKLENKSLRETLNLIAGPNSGYEWKVKDGVVIVFPNKDRDAILEDLLQTKIERFTLERNPSKVKVKSKLGEIPSIKAKVENKKMYWLAVAFVGPDFRKIGKDFSLDVSDKSLLEVLNEIIKQSDVRFWAINRLDKEFIIINL